MIGDDAVVPSLSISVKVFCGIGASERPPAS